MYRNLRASVSLSFHLFTIICSYRNRYELRWRKPPSPGILKSGLDKLLAACVLSSRRATDFIGNLYELSGKPSPSGVQVLGEPKRKVFELLDMAKEILSPLTEYETTVQEILDTLEEVCERLMLIHESNFRGFVIDSYHSYSFTL